MLTLKNLSLTASDAQGRTDIVKNVSLDVEDGKFLVITGPNGGGKTTLAKLIMGLAVPTGGQILLDGEDITPLSITDRARRGISYSFQQPPRFKGMKVSDLLTIAAGKTLSHDEACSYLTQVGLCARDYLGRDVDTSLSGGEVKRIEIATLLAKNSRLMIFDEPEAGIDLWSFARLTETFRDLHEKGRHTIIIISHQERIIRLADEIVLLANGEIAGRGTADELYPQPAVPDRRRLQSAGGERNMLNDIQKSILQTVSDMVSHPRRRGQHPPRRAEGVPPELRAHPDRLQDRQGRHRHPHRALHQERKRPHSGHPEQVRLPRSGLQRLLCRRGRGRDHRRGLRHPQLRRLRLRARRHPHLLHRQKCEGPLYRKALRRGRRQRQADPEPADHRLS